MRDLTVTLVQSDIVSDNPAANLDNLAMLAARAEPSDLLVLPEVFTTGFHPKARQHAETAQGPVHQWLSSLSARLNAVVTGSVVMHEAGRYTNRLLWAAPEGQPLHYDKRHLFRMAGEHQRYAPGERRVIAELEGWRFLLQVCYDLRFPVFSRNRGDYDAIVYVANWPAARHDHWCALLKARAIENLCYVIGVNRVGRDAYGQDYAGGSVVISPKGELLADAGDIEQVVSTRLSAQALLIYREQFPAHLDADSFTLHEVRPADGD